METRMELLENIRNQVGRMQLNHQLTGMIGEVMSRTVAVIDNRDGRSADVVDRILHFADALLYEIDLNEYYEATDFLDFQFDSQHYELNPGEFSQNWELGEYAEWEDQREAIRKAESLRVIYSYADGDFAELMVGDGFHALLKDLLADGRRADCVALYTQIYHGVKRHEDGLDEHICRRLVMNGRINGEYVDGPVPFVQDDALIRRFGGWRQAALPTEDEFEELIDSSNQGIYFRLCKPLGKTLEARLRKCLRAFQERVNCEMEIRITDKEALRFFKKEKPFSPEDIRDLEGEERKRFLRFNTHCRQKADFSYKEELLMKFPDYTGTFTEAEMEKLEALFGAQGDAYVQYAADSECPLSAIPRIRLVGMLEACSSFVDNIEYAEQNPEECLGAELFEKLEAIWHTWMDEILIVPVSGPGDWTEEEFARQMCRIQHFVFIHNIYLSGIDDVHALCALLDELDEIAALANAGSAPIERKGQYLYRISKMTDCPSFDSEFSPEPIFREKKWQKMNLHERLHEVEKLLAGESPVDFTTGTEDGVILFEAENYDDLAHLRFRKKDGQYICEIAGVEF